MSTSSVNLLQHAIAVRERGGSVIGGLVVRTRGSTPQPAGAMMLVDEHGGTLGTIGGGSVEAEVTRRATEMLAAGATGLLHFRLDEDHGWDDGMMCGGELDVAIGPLPEPDAITRILEDVAARRETALPLVVDTDDGPARFTVRIPPRDRLYVVGAGHVGRAVARLAGPLAFEVTVFDDRADVLDGAEAPGVQTRHGDPAVLLADAPVDDRTYCVIVTRGHRHDELALGALVDRGARYVGMIGGKRKIQGIAARLAERGVSPAAIERVHAPIGVPIGATTVEEIAVSIAAELVQARRSGDAPLVVGPEPAGTGATRGTT
jgi:xanthine dehydrogenase accessory factor